VAALFELIFKATIDTNHLMPAWLTQRQDSLLAIKDLSVLRDLLANRFWLMQTALCSATWPHQAPWERHILTRPSPKH